MLFWKNSDETKKNRILAANGTCVSHSKRFSKQE